MITPTTTSITVMVITAVSQIRQKTEKLDENFFTFPPPNHSAFVYSILCSFPPVAVAKVFLPSNPSIFVLEPFSTTKHCSVFLQPFPSIWTLPNDINHAGLFHCTVTRPPSPSPASSCRPASPLPFLAVFSKAYACFPSRRSLVIPSLPRLCLAAACCGHPRPVGVPDAGIPVLSMLSSVKHCLLPSWRLLILWLPWSVSLSFLLWLRLPCLRVLFYTVFRGQNVSPSMSGWLSGLRLQTQACTLEWLKACCSAFFSPHSLPISCPHAQLQIALKKYWLLSPLLTLFANLPLPQRTVKKTPGNIFKY